MNLDRLFEDCPQGVERLMAEVKRKDATYHQYYAREFDSIEDLLPQWRKSLAFYQSLPDYDNDAQAIQSDVLTGIYGRYLDLCEAEGWPVKSKSPFEFPHATLDEVEAAWGSNWRISQRHNQEFPFWVTSRVDHMAPDCFATLHDALLGACVVYGEDCVQERLGALPVHNPIEDE